MSLAGVREWFVHGVHTTYRYCFLPVLKSHTTLLEILKDLGPRRKRSWRLGEPPRQDAGHRARAVPAGGVRADAQVLDAAGRLLHIECEWCMKLCECAACAICVCHRSSSHQHRRPQPLRPPLSPHPCCDRTLCRLPASAERGLHEAPQPTLGSSLTLRTGIGCRSSL